MEEFDYIIVGAGSAGCALANRLSANPSLRVALIEAGTKDSNPWIHIPVGYSHTMGNPATDWCYKTMPDAGLNGRSIPWPRGKVLGGSSSLNGLLYVRGQREDYDDWASMGNKGWAWDEVAPIFKRMESWGGDDEDGLHGKDGPLSVEKSRYQSQIVDEWVQAAHDLGYPLNHDYNGKVQEGVGLFQLTTKKGRRCSSAVAYLRCAKKRKNLAIRTDMQVEKIIFTDKKATGIMAKMGQINKIIHARREIILCTGALASPLILMRSGIGNAKNLTQWGIKPLHNLPGVGKNLQDHLQARPIYRCKLPTINSMLASRWNKMAMALQYLLYRTGPMSMAASLGVGFVKSDEKLDRPDLQFHIQPFSAGATHAKPHDFSAFTASILQMRPQSTGHIDLNPDDPMGMPFIYPHYLSHENDRKCLVAGIKIARKICAQMPLSQYIIDEYSPGSHVNDNDDEAILQWAKDHSTTIYHPTGTCKMGIDKMAVLSPDLRVYGVEGLRVADASIMPMIVSGNTNAPCIMIGEKASDLILKEVA